MQPLRINLQTYYCLQISVKSSMISFRLYTELYKHERRTVFGNGFCDKEKKNTLDNFELHLELELGNRRNKGFVLILKSFVPKTELKSARWFFLRCRVDLDGIVYGVPTLAIAEWSWSSKYWSLTGKDLCTSLEVSSASQLRSHATGTISIYTILSAK